MVEPLDDVLERFQTLIQRGSPTTGDLSRILGTLVRGVTGGDYPPPEGTEAILAVWNALVATASAYRVNRVDATWDLHHDSRYAPPRGSPPANYLAFVIAHNIGKSGIPEVLARSVDATPPYTLDGIKDMEDYFLQIQEHLNFTPTRAGGVPPPPSPPPPGREGEEREEGRREEQGPPRVTFGPGPAAPSRVNPNAGASLWAGMNPQTRLDVLDIALGIVNPVERQRYAGLPWEKLPLFLRALISERAQEVTNYLRRRETEIEEGGTGQAGPPPAPAPPPPSPPPSAPPPPQEAPRPVAPPQPALPPITTAEALRPPYLEDFTTFPKGTVTRRPSGTLEGVAPVEVDIIAELSRAVRTGNFARCYVFGGPPGLGKTTLAYAFVRTYLRDLGRRRKTPELGAPNLPLEQFGAVIFGPNDMAGGVDFVLRRVIPSMRTMPLGSPPGTRRFIILDDISTLSPEAQERLLVPMEQTSRNATIIFTANSTSRLIPPLVSRCLSGFFLFRQPTPAQIASAVRNTIVRMGAPFPDTEQEVARVMAQQPESIRDAMDYLVQDYSELRTGEANGNA